MQYIIGKIEKSSTFSSIFGQSESGIKWMLEESYPTSDSAKDKIRSYQKALDEKTDYDYEDLSEEKRERIDKEIEEPNTCFYSETYLILPVEEVIELTSVPEKHRIDTKEEK